jgi:integrase
VTYNNYVKLGRTLFTWLVDRCFTDSNKFEKIKKKTAGEKNRILIAPAHRKQLLDATNLRPHYATLCMLVYSALIRPNEIRHIQLKHIHLDDCYIEIPGENAKNHHTRRSALTPQLVERLRSMNLDRYPADYYLFGSYIEPDKDMAAESTYRSYFDKVRERLGWDARYTLYSFRDTGITEMLEAGIPNIDVMKHADHSSLDVTTIYTRHKDKSLIDKISSRAPKF